MVGWRIRTGLSVTCRDLSDTKTTQVWETAGKNGLLTANLMWPGPPVTVDGISHTYFVPFKVFEIPHAELALMSFDRINIR